MTLKTTRKRWSRSRYFQIEEEHSNGATKLSRSYACTLKHLELRINDKIINVIVDSGASLNCSTNIDNVPASRQQNRS